VSPALDRQHGRVRPARPRGHRSDPIRRARRASRAVGSARTGPGDARPCRRNARIETGQPGDGVDAVVPSGQRGCPGQQLVASGPEGQATGQFGGEEGVGSRAPGQCTHDVRGPDESVGGARRRSGQQSGPPHRQQGAPVAVSGSVLEVVVPVAEPANVADVVTPVVRGDGGRARPPASGAVVSGRPRWRRCWPLRAEASLPPPSVRDWRGSRRLRAGAMEAIEGVQKHDGVVGLRSHLRRA